MYDILIVGGGVIGCSIARNLSKYEKKIIVLEKEADVCEGTSCANSAIVHSGYDPLPGTLKAKLNVEGNKMFDKLCDELDVEFMRIGSITLANNEEEVEELNKLMERAKENGVEVKLLSQEELREIEPNVTSQALKGLLAPTAGIINPFELTIASMENAMDNGAELALNQEVKSIERKDNKFIVHTQNKVYETKMIINASGVYADIVNEMVNEHSFDIIPRRGEYSILDHFSMDYVKHTLFNVPSAKGKGVLFSPTTHFNYLIGPSADFVDERDDVSTSIKGLSEIKNQVLRLVDDPQYPQQIRTFSGLRAYSDNNDFIIEETSPSFINVAGIQSPGLASSPAIAKMVEDMIKDKKLKESWNPRRRKAVKLSRMSLEEKNELVKKDKSFGHIVCRCEKVSEGEIVDVIRRNCGATTVKGVKKRIRPGMGKCQGGFCQEEVVRILARELNKDPMDILYSTSESHLFVKDLNKEEN